MATRQDIRENVYSELETAIDGLVDPQQVTQESSDATEVLPTLVHNDAYRLIPMNTNTGPSDTITSGNEVTAYVYTRLIEAQFTCTVRSEDELEKESIYEALRQHFEEYTLPVADEKDIHADVYRVEVTDSTSDDDTEREPIARGDSLTVSVFFKRYYERPVDAVDTIEQSLDTDNDSIVDFTQTITQ